jgi:hypothetical protein
VVSLARNGPALGVDSAGVPALAAELVLDELPVLLELPQPATASATPTRARIDFVGTRVSPVVRGIGRDGSSDQGPAPTIPSSALRRRSTHGPPVARFLYDAALTAFLPGEVPDLSRARLPFDSEHPEKLSVIAAQARKAPRYIYGPSGNRTRNLGLKRPLLCRLS